MTPRHSAPCVSSLPSNQLLDAFPAVPYWEVISSWYLQGNSACTSRNAHRRGAERTCGVRGGELQLPAPQQGTTRTS